MPSVPTRAFREPWGLVVNEAMHQRHAVIATDAVGAAAGGLVRDGVTGLVVPAGDTAALAARDAPPARRIRALRERLAAAGREAASAYTYEACAAGVSAALASVGAARGDC